MLKQKAADMAGAGNGLCGLMREEGPALGLVWLQGALAGGGWSCVELNNILHSPKVSHRDL